MRRSSVYFDLRYVVHCQPAAQAFFQPIAAFDHEGVAIAYAKDCRQEKLIAGTEAALSYRYKVTKRKGSAGFQQAIWNSHDQ